MEFRTLTRGNHKVYQLMHCILPAGGRIIASSVDARGNSLPVEVLAKNAEQGLYVLVVAVLPFGQTIEISIVDEAGNVVESVKHIIHHASSALMSKFNTLRKQPDAREIRDYDLQILDDMAAVSIDFQMRYGYEEEESELVMVTIKAACAQDKVSTAFDYALFDIQGVQQLLVNCCILADDFDGSMRTIELSFRKPSAVESYFFWVHFENGMLPGGFVYMAPEDSRNARGRFEHLFAYTGQGGYYEPWFHANQGCSEGEAQRQRETHFDIEPLFSIIVPLFKTPIELFKDMLSSVIGQTYGKFELILVNASPEDADLMGAVEEAVASDNRVRAIKLEGNGGISLNTNEGIKVARGDYLSFFDHDDTLEPDLFFEYVRAINRYPETDLLYCDEDKLSDGHLVDGFQKPDFSWELLTTCNYICHLLTVRKSIVDEVELSGADVAGAQDWDMTMKVAEKARNIYHVRKVLYHWRKHRFSASANPNAKPYTHVAGEIAVQRHFDRIGIPVSVADSPMGSNVHRVIYELPAQQKLVSIVIPVGGDATRLEGCLRSVIKQSTYENLEIILAASFQDAEIVQACIEHCSADEICICAAIAKGIASKAALRNLGAAQAQGEYLLFLDDDTEVMSADWIETLLGPLQRPQVAATGARLLYPDDTIHHIGVVIPRSTPKFMCHRAPSSLVFYYGMLQNAREVSAVLGSCLMVKRLDFEAIGGFDQSFETPYGDVDFCLRLQAEQNKTVVVEPHAALRRFVPVAYDNDLAGRLTGPLVKRDADKLRVDWPSFFSVGDPLYTTDAEQGSAYYELPNCR